MKTLIPIIAALFLIAGCSKEAPVPATEESEAPAEAPAEAPVADVADDTTTDDAVDTDDAIEVFEESDGSERPG